jgi:DNA-directed RNA polymerase specialized sigma24 family protein
VSTAAPADLTAGPAAQGWPAVRTARHAEAATAENLPLPQTDDFVELFRLHYTRLVRALRVAGAPASAAEDFAQEAFARTLRHWRRVRKGTNPPGYLYRIAFRLLRKHGYVPAAIAEDVAVAGPEDAAVLGVDVGRVLAAMPPRRRACAVMCLCLDVTPGDAAEALKIAPGTVRKQIELARRDLQAGVSR